MKLSTATLGFPRMGPNRELKFALEKHWKGLIGKEELFKVAHDVEEQGWTQQKKAGIDRVTVGDFYLYDGILAWNEMIGFVPKRFGNFAHGTDRLFAMARGVDGATALSMKKWITSNYHYMVPEFDESSKVDADFSGFIDDVRRGLDFLGPNCATPVVVGPVTMAYLTKFAAFSDGSASMLRLSFLKEICAVYKSLLEKLSSMGVTEIQIHEAALVMEDPELLSMFQATYPAILPKGGPAINMVSFMEDIGSKHYQWLVLVPEISVISLDFTRGDNMALIQRFGFPNDKTLGAGLVDSRSIWRVDPAITEPIQTSLASLVKKIRIQPSGSLQFVPWDLSSEDIILKHPVGGVLSFAKQKLEEVVAEANAFFSQGNNKANHSAWTKYRAAVGRNEGVANILAGLSETDLRRSEPFSQRRPKQLQGVPLLPTTTIGSFPQTKAIRLLRSKKNKGIMTETEYNAEIDKQIAYAIGLQEALGLDILVHGEAERTDMVEFFAQQMEGMLFTTNGWVQSFGSRCVRPPIIWSDITRPKPMTTREFEVAQGLTDKPVKGMLTGPVTILNWSFPRKDISLKEQALQLALCIRDEITDLEDVGCKCVQVDEPALREAMPLRAAAKQEYLDWAVDAFCLATARAKSETQVHTHMCYCEFHDCMDAIDKLDTDVNSIENARSDNATLLAFQEIGYEKDLGPGTYDIHSPVVPTVAFITEKIQSFLQCLPAERLVINPDCGLKTRTWPETIEALKNMVEATRRIREELKPTKS